MKMTKHEMIQKFHFLIVKLRITDINAPRKCTLRQNALIRIQMNGDEHSVNSRSQSDNSFFLMAMFVFVFVCVFVCVYVRVCVDVFMGMRILIVSAIS